MQFINVGTALGTQQYSVDQLTCLRFRYVLTILLKPEGLKHIINIGKGSFCKNRLQNTQSAFLQVPLKGYFWIRIILPTSKSIFFFLDWIKEVFSISGKEINEILFFSS